MEVNNVQMDSISTNNNKKTTVTQIGSFGDDGQNNISKDANSAPKDTIIFDKTRVTLRSMCESGNVMQHIEEVIASGIEPDSLRAELAFRFAKNDMVGMNIVLNYLAGNFKAALEETEKLLTERTLKKYSEFMLYSDYFAGNYDKCCAMMQNMQELSFSPFLSYAYADMLLSLGFLDEARKFNLKYEVLAKEYLPDFVTEKEKFDEDRKRRNQKLRREKQKFEQKDKKESAGIVSEKDEQSPYLYESLKDLFARRRKIIEILKTRNINIDKKPLLFELEDIDFQIANKTITKKQV